MPYRLLLVCLLCLPLAVVAQKAALRGSLIDSVGFKFMGYSSVSLITARDSVLRAHAWTADNGRFELKELEPDTYLLQVTRPTFADYEEQLVLHPGEVRELPPLQLLSKATLLQEVLVRSKRDAITIKGDTVEYLVDSFLVNKQSTVEDLLKKLPGIQVDKEGKITAHGQSVQKVLVDGEEFFGNDPTVATRNIKAENVDKVQVFDQKSEQAQLTGVDDGEKNKTINLTLKEDAKKGYFGKAASAAGTQQRYEEEAMLNFFSNKRKLSLYGAASNTNKTRMDWEDAEKYTGGDGTREFDESTGLMYSYNYSDESDYNGSGIPKTWYLGSYYSNKFGNQATHSLNGNLMTKGLNVSGYDNNYTRYILPDTTYSNSQRENFSNARTQQSGNLSYEWRVDSLTTFRLRTEVKTGTSDNNTTYTSENLNGAGRLVNSNSRSNNNHGNRMLMHSSATLSRKFKRKGRALSMALSQDYSFNNGDGFLLSQTNYYDTSGAISHTDYIDQKKTSETGSSAIGASASYTEPLGGKWYLVTDASFKRTWNNSNRFSFTKNSNGEYTLAVDSLSSNFSYDIFTSTGGTALRYSGKKVTASAGGRISYTDMSQDNRVTGIHLSRYFTNLFPSARFNYRIHQSSNLSLDYNGQTRQPGMQQLQPLQDNTNPLVVYIGNPTLSQSFNNAFELRYTSFKALTGRNLYLSLGYNFTQHDFTSFDQVDSLGRKTYQTVNINGNYSFYNYVFYYMRLNKKGLGLNCNMSNSYSRRMNYVNGQLNENRNLRLGPSLELNWSKEEAFEFFIGGDWDYNQSTTSLRPDVVTAFWIQEYTAAAEVQLPAKMMVEAECTFNIRQRTSTFDRNLNTTILNAAVRKRLLKDESLTVSLACNDLLNQNLGFNRNASSNFVNENTHTVLKRYLLVSVVWNFTHKQKQSGNTQPETR